MRNYIDVIMKNRGYIDNGDEVGYIKYENGQVKTIKYKMWIM